jgi:hypothetical protein
MTPFAYDLLLNYLDKQSSSGNLARSASANELALRQKNALSAGK